MIPIKIYDDKKLDRFKQPDIIHTHTQKEGNKMNTLDKKFYEEVLALIEEEDESNEELEANENHPRVD